MAIGSVATIHMHRETHPVSKKYWEVQSQHRGRRNFVTVLTETCYHNEGEKNLISNFSVRVKRNTNQILLPRCTQISITFLAGKLKVSMLESTSARSNTYKSKDKDSGDLSAHPARHRTGFPLLP